MRRIALAALMLAWLAPHPADAGYVRTWLDSRGGCAAHKELVLPPTHPTQPPLTFLNVQAEEWTDDMILELAELYGRCAAAVMVDSAIASGATPNADGYEPIGRSLARENTRRLRDEFVIPARRRVEAEARARIAKRQLAEDEAKARVANAERARARRDEDTRERAEQTAARLAQINREAGLAEAERGARLAQAQDQAKRDADTADALALEAENEERNLTEMRRVAEEARQRRRDAEHRLARAREALEAERQQVERQRETTAGETESAALPALARGDCGEAHYRSSDGSCVHRPTKADEDDGPITAYCRDGTHSMFHHHSGTCSRHGGVERWMR